jgi:hypothetical protein
MAVTGAVTGEVTERVTSSVMQAHMPPVTEAGDTGAMFTWVTVPEARTRCQVSLRTMRRWIAEERVISRLHEEDGREVRFIRSDTLPSVTGDVIGDNPQHGTGDVTSDMLHQGDSTGTGDVTGAMEGDMSPGDTGDGGDTGMARLVAAQESEIAHLRVQLEQRALELERRDHAEAELRRLLLISQQALAAVVEPPKALPPAPEVSPTGDRRQVRWWNPATWRRG